MDFQNVGTFDAGVFTPQPSGVPGAALTMDAAGTKKPKRLREQTCQTLYGILKTNL